MEGPPKAGNEKPCLPKTLQAPEEKRQSEGMECNAKSKPEQASGQKNNLKENGASMTKAT